MHSTFKIDIPDGARYILRLLVAEGHEAYIVGGCVRDSLLNKKPNDWDICTSATPVEVCALMSENGIKVIETGLKHGTVTACVGVGSYEITTFRVDGEYSDNRRPDDVEFVDDIKEDLARRDFTINAMAYSEWNGLVDPWGGYSDLCNGIIRCVGNPDDRFNEDGLRILRALRFASTYEFMIEPDTAAAIHRHKELLKNISAERIQAELTKMLCGEGILDILLEYSDVMAVIIPELEPCIGFNQNNPYHIYTVYDHIAHAVDNYKGSDISIKMALLLHDIGKPECYSEDHNGGHFHGHSVPGMRMAKEIMTRLKFDAKTRDEVVDLVLYHDADIYPGMRSVKRWLNKVGPGMLEKLLSIRMADIGAHSLINQAERFHKCYEISRLADQIVSEQQCFKIGDLAVNGHDIMLLGIESGPRVGWMLNHLLDMVLDETIENEHDVLMTEAKRYLEEIRSDYV